MPDIKGYFKSSPFVAIAGRLSEETGRDDFVILNIHKQLTNEIDEEFSQHPITVRILMGQQGGGKTWTLSWLSRSYEEMQNTLVIAVPRIELRGKPERGFVEGIFRGLRPSINAIKSSLQKAKIPKDFEGTATEYVWKALFDPGTFAILSGSGGTTRLPNMGWVSAPQLTKTEGLIELVLGLFHVIRLAGFTRVLVLLDEIESLFLVFGKTNIFIFENIIRGVYDEFESDNSRTLPRLVMILGGTYSVLEGISPALVGKQTEESGITVALARRLAQPFLLVVNDESEALEIVQYRIGQHRRRQLDEPYIPYEEEAIIYVWKNTLGNIGDYCRALQEMYEIALREKAQKITLDHAQRTIKKLRASGSA